MQKTTGPMLATKSLSPKPTRVSQSRFKAISFYIYSTVLCRHWLHFFSRGCSQGIQFSHVMVICTTRATTTWCNTLVVYRKDDLTATVIRQLAIGAIVAVMNLMEHAYVTEPQCNPSGTDILKTWYHSIVGRIGQDRNSDGRDP